MTDLDAVVSGGTVVTGAGAFRADVGVREGTVVALGDLGAAHAAQTIDASGTYVLPGAVDEHVHPIYLDDPRQTSIAGLHGGTTTLMHFAYAKPGMGLVEALDGMLEAARDSEVDYAVHLGLFDAARQIPEIDAVCERGVRSFKMFLTYAALGWMTDDHQLARAMERIARNDGLAMVHAENGPAIEYLEAEAAAGRRGRGDAAATWLATRPAVLEAEGVFRATAIAETMGCDLWVPHVTCERAVEVVASARARGLRVVAETCPHYLALTEDAVREHGALAKVGPPLRTAADAVALWGALQDGVLQAIGSDHAPKKDASEAGADLLGAGFGAPAVETLLPVVYDAGVNGGHISPIRLVQFVSENPARIFGLFPRKGTIAVGSDADLVVWDPVATLELTAAALHSNAGYTLYEGRRCTGAPRVVMAGGRVLVRDGRFVGEVARGRFLPTGPIDVLLDD